MHTMDIVSAMYSNAQTNLPVAASGPLGHTVTEFVFQSVSRSTLLWHFVNVCKLTGTGVHTCR